MIHLFKFAINLNQMKKNFNILLKQQKQQKNFCSEQKKAIFFV